MNEIYRIMQSPGIDELFRADEDRFIDRTATVTVPCTVCDLARCLTPRARFLTPSRVNRRGTERDAQACMTHRSVLIVNRLDSHDALARDCAAGRMPFIEFLAAYGDFPHGYVLEQEGEAWTSGTSCGCFANCRAHAEGWGDKGSGSWLTRYPDMEIPGAETHGSS